MGDLHILRESLAPEYASASREQLESVVQRIYGPGVSPEDVEGFFDDLGRGFKQAAGAVTHFGGQALPGIIQGATAGSALGPYGMLAGAIAGGAGSILSHTNNPTARAIGGGLSTATGLLSAVRGGGAGGATGALSSIAGMAGGGAAPSSGNPFAAIAGGAGGSGGSANALLSLLARPEILQALMSGAMGQFGRQQLSVGGQQVPVQAMLGALGTVAQRAAHEAAELDERAAETTPEYVTMAGEALGLDVDDAEGRTDALLTLLALSPMIWGGQSQRPVTVNVQPDVPPALPRPPEPIFVAASGEDYELEPWEGDEGFPELEEFAWDQGGIYV